MGFKVRPVGAFYRPAEAAPAKVQTFKAPNPLGGACARRRSRRALLVILNGRRVFPICEKANRLNELWNRQADCYFDFGQNQSLGGSGPGVIQFALGLFGFQGLTEKAIDGRLRDFL